MQSQAKALGRLVAAYAALTGSLRTHPFLWSAGLSVGLTACTLACLFPIYETNDDTAMNLIAAGLVVTDRPDEHLVFTNVLLGLVLKWLYELEPRIPWYGSYQSATIAAAYWAISYSLLKISPTPRQLVVVILIFTVGVLPCLTVIQFTKTAFVAALAGIMLLAAPLHGATPWPRAAHPAGALFVVLGSLIRAESVLLACALAAPILVIACWQAPWRALRGGAWLAGALAVAALLYYANREYYARDEGWKNFYEYNAIRAEFTDYFRYRRNAEATHVFRAVGWEPVDLMMLCNWFFADKRIYSLAHLQRIHDEAPRDPVPSVVATTASILKGIGTNQALLRLALVAACAGVLAAGGWRGLVVPALLSGVALAVAVALGMWFWLTPRLAFTLLSGVLILGTFRPPLKGPLSRSDHVLVACAAAVAVGLTAWSLAAAWQSSGYRHELRQTSEATVRDLKPRRDQLYVVWGESFPFILVVPPLRYPDALADFRCVALSWLIPTPFTEERYREFQIGADCPTKDIYRAIWERPDVFLIVQEEATEPARYTEMFKYYAALHYHVRISFEPTFDCSRYRVYQARP
jgi:hypothetical protein